MSTIFMPPTCNVLPSRERARLIQSTRKLGAILGTTPQLADSIEPKKRRRSPTISSGSFDSIAHQPTTLKSSVSLRLVSRPAGEKKTPSVPLVLHLEGADRASENRDHRMSFMSAFSTKQSQPLSPLSPTFANNGSTDVRRKRLAKLARTLGENIPPELVFPDNAVKAQRRRSHTLSSASHKSVPINVSEAFILDIRPNETPRSSAESSARPSFESTTAKSKHQYRAESLAFASTGFPVLERTVSRTDSENSWTYVVPAGSQTDLLLPTTTRRKEREWSGEWNANDMKDVLQRLRQLK